jgi:hypothetical protein
LTSYLEKLSQARAAGREFSVHAGRVNLAEVAPILRRMKTVV